ncbi:rhamnulokinase [Lactococcus hodotermopsidis]|uniref:rhamnulokinase n=1 Tax=Pseudolactococcus hodotermopsidis TaxID=2709157 RepID=UPI00353125A4
MENKYIAVDIGASSGRLMLSELGESGKLSLQEIHRFKNRFRLKNDLACWDIGHLVQEILLGLQKAKQSGIEICTVGIDTWAVDYCLIDKNGDLISEPVAYRDDRTEGVLPKFAKEMPLEFLYQKTGVQILAFNTVFQLFVENREKLQQADKLLLIPDYLGYVFTGQMVCEKTNASTMAMLNVTTKTWDKKILKILNITEDLFASLVDSGHILGALQTDKFSDYDLPEATFITVASHDTASAVLGTPLKNKHEAYISSGTWSLLGVETHHFNVSQNAFCANYTNEWGAYGTTRFLKNIMGMWLIQEVARNQGYIHSYGKLVELASSHTPFKSFIDVNDERFLNPLNMIETIKDYCIEKTQNSPVSAGGIARVIYDNLALCYAFELAALEKLLGYQMTCLHIVGGGANNHLLNQLTANLTGIKVEAGPSEATAIGNIIMQMLAMKAFDNLPQARAAVKNSFEIRTYEPQIMNQAIFENYVKWRGNK